jgi:hypothetical protein
MTFNESTPVHGAYTKMTRANTTSWYFKVEITRCGISKWEKQGNLRVKLFVLGILVKKGEGACQLTLRSCSNLHRGLTSWTSEVVLAKP